MRARCGLNATPTARAYAVGVAVKRRAANSRRVIATSESKATKKPGEDLTGVGTGIIGDARRHRAGPS